MSRDGLSLYSTSSKRWFGMTLYVALLGLCSLFAENPVVGQDQPPENPAAQAQLDQARSLRQNNQYPEATQAFTNIISTYPQTDYALQAYQDLTVMQVDQGISTALETLRQGLMQDFANHPKIAEAVYQVVNASRSKLRWGVEHDASAERLAYLDGVVRQISSDILQRWPDSPQAMWAQRGIVFADIHKGDYAAAQAATETLVANYQEHKDLPQAVCWLGNDYRRMKQYDKARSCYQYTADNWPGNEFGGQSQFELVLLGVELQEDAATEAAINSLLAKFSAPVVYQVVSGIRNKLWRGVEQKAPAERLAEYDGIVRQLCGHIIQQWPDSHEAMWAQRGIVFAEINLGDYAAADAATETLIAKYPNHKDLVQAFSHLGNDYRRMKQYDKARDCYQYVADQGPQNPYALSAQQQVVMMSFKLQEDSAAEAAIDALLTNFAEHKEIPNVISQVAQTYHDKLRQGVKQQEPAYYAAMIKRLYGHILTHQPDSERAMWAQRGIAFAEIHLGDYAAADAAIETLLADYPDHKDLAQALYFLGNDFHRMKQYAKARTYYQYICDQWPQTDQAIMAESGVIRCNLRLNQVEDINTAITLLTEKYQDHPILDHVILEIGEEYLRIAKALDKQGQVEAVDFYSQALSLFEKIIREMPDSQYLPHAHYMGGGCLVKLMQFAQGVGYFQKVVDNWPDFKFAGSAQLLVGCYTRVMRDRGDIPAEQADPLIQIAFENVIDRYKVSSTPHIYELALKRLGQLHMKHDHWQEAVMYFETFRQEFPDSHYFTSSVLYDLVRAYEGMGEPALAIDVCEEFIQTCPDDRRIDGIKAKRNELTALNLDLVTRVPDPE
jgi:outer membrane protein assembly factor BamD (BamD/ComL family)